MLHRLHLVLTIVVIAALFLVILEQRRLAVRLEGMSGGAAQDAGLLITRGGESRETTTSLADLRPMPLTPPAEAPVDDQLASDVEASGGDEEREERDERPGLSADTTAPPQAAGEQVSGGAADPAAGLLAEAERELREKYRHDPALLARMLEILRASSVEEADSAG